MIRIYSVFILICGCTAPVFAQSTAGSAKLTADQQWRTIVAAPRPVAFSPAAATESASVQQQRQKSIATYLKQADQLRQFYQQYPDDSRANEARRQEALALLGAWAAGDTVNAARRDAIVTAVRQDTTLSVQARQDVAARADYLAVAEQQIPTRANRELALEKAARRLQAEFPTIATNYLALVRVASASADDRAGIIARDVLNMPAPQPIKAQAQVVLDRLGLEGQPIGDVAAAAIGGENPFSAAVGHPILVYTWSSSLPDSIALAKHLATKAPVGATLIGVCLDVGDPAKSKSRAATLSVPGEQIFDRRGYDGALARRLYLTQPGWVYVADAKGTIRSVSAQHDIDAAIGSILPN